MDKSNRFLFYFRTNLHYLFSKYMAIKLIIYVVFKLNAILIFLNHLYLINKVVKLNICQGFLRLSVII